MIEFPPLDIYDFYLLAIAAVKPKDFAIDEAVKIFGDSVDFREWLISRGDKINGGQMKPREFWFRARGMQENRVIDVSIPGENRWIDTTIQQVYPDPANSAAAAMGPWMHVIEKSAFDQAVAALKWYADHDPEMESEYYRTGLWRKAKQVLKELGQDIESLPLGEK